MTLNNLFDKGKDYGWERTKVSPFTVEVSWHKQWANKAVKGFRQITWDNVETIFRTVPTRPEFRRTDNLDIFKVFYLFISSWI